MTPHLFMSLIAALALLCAMAARGQDLNPPKVTVTPKKHYHTAAVTKQASQLVRPAVVVTPSVRWIAIETYVTNTIQFSPTVDGVFTNVVTIQCADTIAQVPNVGSGFYRNKTQDRYGDINIRVSNYAPTP